MKPSLRAPLQAEELLKAEERMSFAVQQESFETVGVSFMGLQDKVIDMIIWDFVSQFLVLTRFRWYSSLYGPFKKIVMEGYNLS